MSTSAKSRNFRRRGDGGGDDANEADAGSLLPAPSTTGRKPASATTSTSTKLSSSSKPKKLLSFADDEEEEDAAPPKPRGSAKPKPPSSSSSSSSRAPKPPASSHKLTSSSSKGRAPPTLGFTTSNVQSPAGTYTKETLLELHKNMLKVAKPSSGGGGGGSGSGNGSEPRIVLKGLLKPAENEEAEKEVEEESRVIPDEETIRKIRAKRERLRKSRGLAHAPDYISLEGGSGLGGASRGGMSDDDGDDDEDEKDGGGAGFGIGKKEKGVAGVFDVVVDDGAAKGGLGSATDKYAAGREEMKGGDEDEDEEDRLWEEEQFRKGLGKRMDDASGGNRVHGGNVGMSGGDMVHNHQRQLQPQPQQRPVAYGPGPNIGGAYGSYTATEPLSISQQGEIAMKALQDSIPRLRESHGRTMTSLNRTDDNLSSSLMKNTALDKSASAAGEKYIFMQKIRQFVSVLCEFLQHKAPFIEELEEQMRELHEQRASAVILRRSADDDDEMLEVEAAVKAANLVFREHGNGAAMIDAAASAAQAAIAAIKKQSNLPTELDEFGRDVNQQKRMDMKRRAEARHRRRTRKKFSSMDVDSLDMKVEGESSTDESDSETTAYKSNYELLLQTADEIFSDASEEYSKLTMVKEMFERWKREFSASYRDAYVSLSAPAIFSPYVRLELLKWDPLHKNTDFFSMKWHSLLFDYGMLEDSTTLDSETGDADIDLVPELVEKVAIPILHHEITHCWDIYSTRQTENAVSATSSVINYIKTSSEALKELLVAIRSRLADAVSALSVPTWSPLIMKAVPSAGAVAAYRFGTSIRLLRSIGLWKDIIAVSVLEKLALDDVLCGKVLPHLLSISSNIHDAVTRTERVVASLSGAWAGPNVTSGHRQKLQPLVDFVLSLGRTLEKKHLSVASEAETNGLARRLKKMLVMLDDYDNARQIARTFRLKEAL